MKILLTGGTGFVGAGVLTYLLQRGCRINALARPGSIGRLPSHPGCTPVAGDPLDPEAIADAAEGCGAVVHLVGIRRKDIKRTGRTYDDIDVGSVLATIEGMRRAGVGRLLLLSAGAIGNSVYVQAKGRAEKAVRDSGLSWTIFRPSFILGPGQQWPRILTPFLGTLGILPGHLGDVARRAGNITLEELAASIWWALGDDRSIGMILDVPDIRTAARRVGEMQEMAGR